MSKTRLGKVAVVSLTILAFATTLAFPEGAPRQDRYAPPGTLVKVRLSQELSSKTNQVGDAVHARLADPIVSEGQVVFPVGSEVTGEVLEVKPAGRMWQNGEIKFVFNRIIDENGKEYAITANLEGASKFTKDSWKRRLYTIAIAAGAGIIVSKIFGGSVLKGLLIGGAAGTGYTLYRKNEDVVLPVGTTINLVLEETVNVAYEFAGAETEDQPIEEKTESKDYFKDVTPREEIKTEERADLEYYSDSIEVGPRIDIILRNDSTRMGVFAGVTEEGKFILDVEYGVLLIPISDIQEVVFDSSVRSRAGMTADTVYLRDGRTMSGNFLGFYDGKFIMSSQYGEMRIPLDDVGRIAFAY